MKKSRPDSVLNPTLLRYIVNFWTIVLYIVIIGDFYFKNTWVEFLGPIASIYIAALALYSAEKEFERWHDYNVGRHPGDVYVFIWTLIITILFIAELISYKSYRVPSEVFTTYIVVIGILAITRKSKSRYHRNKKETQE